MSKKATQAKQEKAILHEFESACKEFRAKMGDQLKCLGDRTDVQVASLSELQEFFRRRGELEAEHAGRLEKLAKGIAQKHKTERGRREAWSQHTSCTVWQTLVDQTKDEAKKRNNLAELFSKKITASIESRCEDLVKLSKRCREIGSYSHNELNRVLNELHTAMKTYQLCYAEYSGVERKKRAAEDDKRRYEDANPQRFETSRKHKQLTKYLKKREEKYESVRVKCTKARNEYLLCVKAANAALHRFFAQDLSYIIDCMDLGMDFWLRTMLEQVIDERKRVAHAEMDALAELGTLRSSVDSKADKQRFFEANHNLFMLPKQFEFRPQLGDDICEVSAEQTLSQDLMQRQWQIEKRLDNLRFETDEVWKTLEASEKQILTLYSNGSDEDMAKSRESLLVTYQYYMKKFEVFLLNGNLIERLEARSHAIGEALERHGHDVTKASELRGQCNNGPSTNGLLGGANPSTATLSNDVKRRAKRIGRVMGDDNRPRPKLFGGSLDEYVEATGEPIPLLVVSAVRYLSRFSLRNQGLFRVSGSQSEINRFKDSYERGEDVFADLVDGSESNSVAGVLKLYLRELREPIFPIFLFEQFCNCAQATTPAEFICQTRELVSKLPLSHVLLLRFLFSFLSHLCEFADENMMEPPSMAICFGPTLLPIPEGKDQVFYQNYVNKLVQYLIIHADEVFPRDLAGPVYDKYALQVPNDAEELGYIEDGEPMSDDEENHGHLINDGKAQQLGLLRADANHNHHQNGVQSMLDSTYDTDMTSSSTAMIAMNEQPTSSHSSPRDRNDLDSQPPSVSSRSSNRSSNLDNYFRRMSEDTNGVSSVKVEMQHRLANELSAMFKHDRTSPAMAILRHSNAAPLWESNEAVHEERDYVSPPALISAQLASTSSDRFLRTSSKPVAPSNDYHEIDALEDVVAMTTDHDRFGKYSSGRDLYAPIQPRATTMPPVTATVSQSSIASSSNSVAGTTYGVRMVGKPSLRDQLQMIRKEKCNGREDGKIFATNEPNFGRKTSQDTIVLDARGSIDSSNSGNSDLIRKMPFDGNKKGSVDQLTTSSESPSPTLPPAISATSDHINILRNNDQPDVISSSKPRAISPTLEEMVAVFNATRLD
ncbi:unnamed protein product [Caenorhabditis auriculariae]|uniref:Rho-GAP domain-containing protein n=1 Tax=Caenorhabditis auriculariae TaxID=2777116 RepID=A0A8S1HBT4_9PELO|nr:unnamed protein product [Caenorhabditis auriculariae]